MNKIDTQYLSLLEDILANGTKKTGRNGDTISVFGRTMRFNFDEGFPILTTKKIHFSSIVTELLWFLKGDTDIQYLHDHKTHIWDGDLYAYYEKDCIKNDIVPLNKKDFISTLHEERKNYYELKTTLSSFYGKYGNLGPIYGKQWRRWQTWIDLKNGAKGSIWIDQIANLIVDLKKSPDSRRMIVNAWNVADISNNYDLPEHRYMTLPPCHFASQFYTQELTISERLDLAAKTYDNFDPFDFGIGKDDMPNKQWHKMIDDLYPVPKRKISCLVHIRSNDFFLGAPFNISSYALLLSLIAKEVNMVPYELIYEIGDCHIYCNQLNAVHTQLKRTNDFELPKLHLEDDKQILDYLATNFYEPSDIKLIDYKSQDIIKAPLSN